MQTGDTRYIYQKDLDKACFQHDIVYGNYFWILLKSIKSLIKFWEIKFRAFKIVSNPKYYGNEKGLAPMIYEFFDKN